MTMEQMAQRVLDAMTPLQVQELMNGRFEWLCELRVRMPHRANPWSGKQPTGSASNQHHYVEPDNEGVGFRGSLRDRRYQHYSRVRLA